MERSQGQCELCKSSNGLTVYPVPPHSQENADDSILVCEKCLAQLNKKEEPDPGHWSSCLSESMWSEVPAVQVVSWRMLGRFRNETWASDNLDILYLSDELLDWAKKTGDHESSGEIELHRDCNGAQLFDGDTITLMKSLDVKGSTLNAKMGTVVKNIRLVADNTEQVEGKIDGMAVIILTKFVRKK
ncbi:MAG: phosphonoacetate hydrolase [Bacteroidetes bacterium]|nr:MAG: phosphonoacetate hydrolase [Bacteroidota bacterium]